MPLTSKMFRAQRMIRWFRVVYVFGSVMEIMRGHLKYQVVEASMARSNQPACEPISGHDPSS
jgi:hypothetical protein